MQRYETVKWYTCNSLFLQVQVSAWKYPSKPWFLSQICQCPENCNINSKGGRQGSHITELHQFLNRRENVQNSTFWEMFCDFHAQVPLKEYIEICYGIIHVWIEFGYSLCKLVGKEGYEAKIYTMRETATQRNVMLLEF